jgi:hypothetical protein
MSTFLVQGVAHTTDNVFILAMSKTMGMKSYVLLQISVTFYELQKNFKTSLSSKKKKKTKKYITSKISMPSESLR